MSFKTKLLQLYAKFDLNPTSLSRKLNYSSAEKIARLTRDESNQPSYQILQDLIKGFPEINPHWWFTEDDSGMVEENRTHYGYCKECLKKEGEINRLEKMCAQKDKRIEELSYKLGERGASGQAASGEKAS